MIDFLVLMLINAFAIVGIYLSCGDDMIFDKPARWFEMRIPYYWTKPLFNCPTCMASVHSVLPFWFINEWSWVSVGLYLIYVPALAGLSTYLSNLIIEE